MRFREAATGSIQKLTQEHWEREISWAEDYVLMSPAKQQLVAFSWLCFDLEKKPEASVRAVCSTAL